MSKVLAPIIFFVIAVGLFFTYIKPAYSTLQEWQAVDAKLETALDDARKIKVRVEELLDKRSAIPKEDYARLLQLLPDNLDIVRIIVDIDTIAEANNLTISRFDIPRVENDTTPKKRDAVIDPVGSAVLTITCLGTYEDFKKWLQSIEKSLNVLDVSSVEVEVEQGGAGAPLVQEYKVGIRTYWLQ